MMIEDCRDERIQYPKKQCLLSHRPLIEKGWRCEHHAAFGHSHYLQHYLRFWLSLQLPRPLIRAHTVRKNVCPNTKSILYTFQLNVNLKFNLQDMSILILVVIGF